MEAVLMRILDTWASAVVTLELAAAYYFFGREGLFIAFTSGWICQSITLWFNIANHPPNDAASDKDKLCKASDGQAPVSNTLYLPFYVLDALYPLFAVFVMEGEHELHHLHPTLAKRSASDIAYWTFIKPLEMLGLVWNVVL